MTAEDLATLKARIEAALADSVKEFGDRPGPAAGPTRIAMPLARAWALANLEDTRALLTDRAVSLLTETKNLVVTLTEQEIVIEAPAETPPKPREDVTVPTDGAER
ncbi:hypothetical protein [Singulisphaera acidiphila]|uniref:Uncharacterized protein n=1 Tax=Singulisphaera acidiphila (strain ATCC BAA-1392 / DSM 18658 / VKM B-2454 / MOB10) TaxID=886293 RepID=L0DIC4_SINAD|nr:hypothetical protein [Singulisphaera acidiphila]AGA28381.1 hypothetical protein Sinac_4174 [Singulisphaera acidiphila DSM 18658]